MCTYTSSRMKRKGFYRKNELHLFLLMSAGHVGAPKRTPIWRLRTKLYKGAWNVSENNSETVGHKDLTLGQIVYILVFYNISFSWILLENGSEYIFFIAWQWKRFIRYSIRVTDPCIEECRSMALPEPTCVDITSHPDFQWDPLFNWSPEMSWRTGSISTSLHTILRNSASRSLSSLWRWVIKPPSLQIIDWSIVKVSPQAHVEGISSTGQ